MIDKINRICAIYCRVSTIDQNPMHQEEYLKRYAVNHNITVFKVYTDYITGRKDSRPSLDLLLGDMRDKLFNCILVYKIDRLGRSVKHLLNISEECFNKNISLVFATQDIDTTTPVGKMFFTILGSIAEFESSLISERTKLGLRRARNVGKRGKDQKSRRRSGYMKRWSEYHKKMKDV